MEVRIDVEEYGLLVVRPNAHRHDQVYVGIIDDDGDGDERELLVLTNAELKDLFKALVVVSESFSDSLISD